MKRISWSNLKGGTGKSLVCFNMASVSGQEKSKKVKPKRILVADTDPQGNISNDFGMDRLKKGVPTIVDVFEHNIPAEEVITRTNTPNVSIIMGSLNLTATELKIVNQAGREWILTNWLNDNKVFLENNFDYLYFDTPPSFNILCQNVYLASDSIVLVNDVSMNSIEGAEQFCALWRAVRMQLRVADNVEGFLLNNVDSRLGISNDCRDYIQRHQEFSSMLFNSTIPNASAFKYSELEGKPINYFESKTIKKSAILKCREAMENLHQEMIQRGIL